MTSRDDMAGLAIDCLAAEYADPAVAAKRLREGTMPSMAADKVLRAMTALADSLTSRSMEAGEPLAEEFTRLVESYRTAPSGSPVSEEAWNLIADFAIENSAALTAALSPVPGEGVTEEMVERAAAKLPLGCVKGPSHLESRLGERRKLARDVLTAALSPPVKGKE